MSIKSDKWIRMMANEYRMIEPYEPGQVKEVEGKRIVSYGTSSYGYDIRCADEFKLFTNINSTIVDPKEFDEKNFVDIKGESVIIPPNSFALARTVEYFRIPRNVLTICLGKSTYARCGILVNVTPFEPEWEGYVTLEFSNTTPLPAKIYANEGVAQVVFFESDEVCETSYKDRGGKYQGQHGVTLPTVPDDCEQSFHMYYMLLPSLETRTELIDHLKKHEILSVFHYLPLNLSDMGRQFGGKEGECPVTEDISDRLLRLPFYNDMTEEEQDRVIAALYAFEGW